MHVTGPGSLLILAAAVLAISAGCSSPAADPSPIAAADTSAAPGPATPTKARPSESPSQPTSTPGSSASPTATAEDCTPTSQYYRINQCAVPGKTPAQVLAACTIAANGNMWGQSFTSGKEYSDKVIEQNSKICLAGSDLKVSADAPIDVAGCPSGCKDPRGKGKLAYIVVSGKTVGRSPNVVISLPFKADGTAIRGSNLAPNTVDMVNAWYRSFEGE